MSPSTPRPAGHAAVRAAVMRAIRPLIEPGDLDTAVEVGPEDLGYVGTLNRHYGQSRLRFYYRYMMFRRIKPSDVFLDIGCGKGRIVYAAARRRFKRVIGVDLSEDLIAIARANLERNARHVRCGDIELVAADASSYDVPDDVTYVYLYSPVLGETFRQMLGQLIDSVDRAPRTMRVIYANPQEHEAVLASGRFRQVSHWRDPRQPDDRERQVVLFESVSGTRNH